MKKLVELALVSIISILVTLSVVNTTPAVINGGTAYGCSTKDITNMYADYIDQWKKEILVCFDTAEEEVFDNDPIPDIIGPNPDPKKCPCGGSGWIKQGDGHKTKCPYHGEGMAKTIKDHGLIIRKF